VPTSSQRLLGRVFGFQLFASNERDEASDYFASARGQSESHRESTCNVTNDLALDATDLIVDVHHHRSPTAPRSGPTSASPVEDASMTVQWYSRRFASM